MKKEIYIKNRGLAIASGALFILCAAIIVALRLPDIAGLGELLQEGYISYFIFDIIDYILVPICFVALALTTAFFVKKRRISNPAALTVLPFLLTVYMLTFIYNVYVLFLLLFILPIIILAAVNIAKPAEMKLPLTLLLCAYSLTTAIFLTVIIIQQAVYAAPISYWLYGAVNYFVSNLVFPLALALFYASLSPLLSAEEAYRRDTKEYYRKTDIGTAVVLSIVTLGVYSWFWKYRLCKKIKLMNGDRSSCTGEFVCILFVPCYVFYWYYTRSKQICSIAARENIRTEDLSLPSLLLGIFGFEIVSDALIQNSLNKITEEMILRSTYYSQQQAPQPPITDYPQQSAPVQACNEENTQNLSEIEKLKQLKDLKDSGVLTQEEFEAKKADILKKL